MRRLLRLAPSVVGLPVAQAVLVLPATPPLSDPTFVFLSLLSFAAVVLATWLLVTAIAAGLDRDRWRLGLRSLLWTLGLGLILIACAVVNPLIALPALVLAAFILPATATGYPVVAGLRAFRHHPWRTALVATGCLALAVLAWVVALVTGLFVTGALGALLCWLAFTLAGALALNGTSSLLRRAV
ncbi:hypothetical protein HQQ80_03010 [Microbacteriaceae bacterium VKM Ac-2855]|nr:hypothetical protein [Microbacteriaceae bacterium VKM Ac-2855]